MSRIRVPVLVALLVLAIVPARATAAQDPAREPPIQVEVLDDRGFSWADAGIGALAAVGVVLVAAGAWVGLRGAPHPRRRTSAHTADEVGPHAHHSRRR